MVSAPVPQPTSTQHWFRFSVSHEMNSCATGLLQRPTYRSYASPAAQTSDGGWCIVPWLDMASSFSRLAFRALFRGRGASIQLSVLGVGSWHKFASKCHGFWPAPKR